MEIRSVFTIDKKGKIKIMKFIKKLSITCSMLLIGFLVSCVGENTTNKTDNQNAYQGVNIETIMVKHTKGETEVNKNPQRVVTFDYGSLDILENLGIDVLGLPKETLPKMFEKYKDSKYENLGGLKEPDFEAINALNPELIIISGRQSDMYDKFSQIAPTILLSIDGSKYMEDLTNNANVLGSIFGKEDIVATKLNEIQSKISELNTLVTSKNLNALTLLVNEGNLSAYGDKSRFGILYNSFGFKNVDETLQDSTHGQQVSFEYVVDKNPNVLFVIDRGVATSGEGAAETVLDNDLIKSTDSYKNENIVYLDAQVWYLVSGGFNSTNSMIAEIENFMSKF